MSNKINMSNRITKKNAYKVLQELAYQAEEMDDNESESYNELRAKILQEEIGLAIQVVEFLQNSRYAEV